MYSLRAAGQFSCLAADSSNSSSVKKMWLNACRNAQLARDCNFPHFAIILNIMNFDLLIESSYY